MDKIAQEAHARQRVLEYLVKHGNVSNTARLYHMSRKTLYKWKHVWDGTWESLKNRSRAPHHCPRKQSEAEIRLVKRLSKKHKWKDPLLAWQEAREQKGYSRSYGCFKRTAHKLMEMKGKKRKTRQNKPYQRASYPGQKVQIDVKYVPRECVTDGNKYYQYTAVDECTRWTFREMYAEHSTDSSKHFMLLLLQKAPFMIRMVQTDNGSEFTWFLRDRQSEERTAFEEVLKAAGIIYHRIKPATPRHNGKVERQHRTDQLRFYDSLRMYNLADGRRQLAAYQKKSNDAIKICLGFRSPNQVLTDYLAVM